MSLKKAVRKYLFLYQLPLTSRHSSRHCLTVAYYLVEHIKKMQIPGENTGS